MPSLRKPCLKTRKTFSEQLFCSSAPWMPDIFQSHVYSITWFLEYRNRTDNSSRPPKLLVSVDRVYSGLCTQYAPALRSHYHQSEDSLPKDFLWLYMGVPSHSPVTPLRDQCPVNLFHNVLYNFLTQVF